MKLRRPIKIDSRGFSIVELLVIIAVIGIITAVSTPAFLSYLRSATLKAGAQELATIINQGRQLAISRNTVVCVKQAAGKMQLRTDAPGCSGTAWTGPGTDGGGWITLRNGINVITATNNVIFNYMGAATTSGIYTVQNPTNNATMSVTVALSGRVTIGP